MRRRFGQALRIGVSSAGLALVKTSRWHGAPLTVLAEHALAGAGPQAIALGLRRLLEGGEYARWPVSFVLADELARIWQVTPPQGSSRLADLQGAAALRFQTLYGEPVSGWAVSASWDAGKPFLAAALARPLLDVLEQCALEHKLKVVEIVPQFVAGFNQWRRALNHGSWYGNLHERVLTIVALDGGSIGAVRACALPDGAGAGWLGAHVAREALRLNLPLPERMQLSGQVPPAWNNSTAAQLLGGQGEQGWAGPVLLAATGSRA